MWTSGVKKSINRIGRVWHLNVLKSVSQPANHLLWSWWRLNRSFPFPRVSWAKEPEFLDFLLKLSTQPRQTSNQWFVYWEKTKCKLLKKHIINTLSFSSLNLSQMPALPPSWHDFFVFSLQVALSCHKPSVRQWVVSWGVCSGASHCAHSVTAHPQPQGCHGVAVAMELVVSDPQLDMVPSALCPPGHGSLPQAFPWVSLCSWSHQWCETPQTRAPRQGIGMDPASFMAVAGAERLLQKGLIPARFSIGHHHGWDREEGPRLQMQRGWTVIFLLQLHCGMGMGSRHEGFLHPSPCSAKGQLCCQ